MRPTTVVPTTAFSYKAEQKSQPVEVPVPPLASTSTPSPPPPAPKPKRRRVPIEIVDGPTLPSATSPVLTKARDLLDPSDLMAPISSRPLASPSSDSSAQAQTSKAAKEARSAARPPGVRGGIFRPNGKHTIFGENRSEHASGATPATAPSPENAQPPTTKPSLPDSQIVQPATPSQVRIPQNNKHGARRRTPWTLFDFSREWDKCSTPEDRWALLTVSPSCMASRANA